jgi:acyl-CoA synthetase (AMP-forming)/AMP-acid ligase II
MRGEQIQREIHELCERRGLGSAPSGEARLADAGLRSLALQNRVLTAAGEATVTELRSAADALAGWAGQRVVLASDDPFEQLTTLIAAMDLRFEAAVVPADFLTEQWLTARRADCHWICRGLRPQDAQRGDAPAGRRASGLVIHSSGSTRAPAPVVHAFERLDTFERVASLDPRRWLVAYRPGSYAWAQVVMLGLRVPGQDLAFAASSAPADLLAGLAGDVSAVSSTPTLWRYLFASAPTAELRQLPLRQITLGGEPVDQPLLDRLRATFPAARITHIYASSECGAVLSCSDGRAGFPSSCLSRASDGRTPAVRVQHGTLRVRSPYAAAGGDGWIDTRDVARVDGDRLHILGRAARDAINVGGHTVALGELERFLQELPVVLWARAYPISSALVGSVVGADVVLDRAHTASELAAERAIRTACRDGLGEPYEPRVVRFFAQPALAPSLKTASRATPGACS